MTITNSSYNWGNELGLPSGNEVYSCTAFHPVLPPNSCAPTSFSLAFAQDRTKTHLQHTLPISMASFSISLCPFSSTMDSSPFGFPCWDLLSDMLLLVLRLEKKHNGE